MKRTTCLVMPALLVLAPSSLPQATKEHEEFLFTRQQLATTQPYVPKAGLVPDAKTAIAIAYAIGGAAYGKAMMLKEQPLRAELFGNVWSVLGTLHCAACDGGTIYVEIDRKTGTIIRLNHTQ